MSSFSERFGLAAPKIELNFNEMPDSLRNGLWDTVKAFYFDDIGSDGNFQYPAQFSTKFAAFSNQIQFSYFKKSVDDISSQPSVYLDAIKTYFFNRGFNFVYDFIEFLMKLKFDEYFDVDPNDFSSMCNQLLAREMAPVRIVGTQFVAITDEHEIREVNEAMASSISSEIATHIKASATLYAQRPEPDYRNSIKESVSAVEAAVRFVTGKKSMGVAKPLKLIESELKIHPALRDGFEKIFAFSSDEGGVRHALMGESNVSQADAKFMLVSCSAFANYLLALKLEQQEV